ncbi:hypothetical protein [Gluconobacter cerinus]|uniref:Uncharacterized protein n=1 Tax=Gluconobacter cerinus TaxID=38307 RepID=A0A1B6VKJ7_9PROT|nr:hypothetical protein [Gluconobacter cerinus]OAJ67745.1 hypothetical protein A0123_01787 [Gluconobacter cerinus]
MFQTLNATVASKISELEEHQDRILDVTFSINRSQMPVIFEKNMGIVASLNKRICDLRAGMPA